MKRANEIEAAASKLIAQLAPVWTQSVQTHKKKPPRLREEYRESVLLCLPDELFREIGKHLPLEHWTALRVLCKAFTEKVDKQPPFILIDPDVDTDALFCQFLGEARPEYAYKLANLVSKISMSEVFSRNDFGKILEEIAKAKSWERIKIRTWKPLFVVARPLLDASGHAPCGAKRLLAYYGAKKLTSKDRKLVEEVQRSSSLQLTTLATEEVADFLPIIARNAEFSDLDLDLQSSAGLTRETFKALQQMHGSVKRLALSCMGFIDSSEIRDALLDKSLESLIINDSGYPGNGIDLLPWLSLQLKSLKLNGSNPNPATLANALGFTETLKKLEINYVGKLGEWPKGPGELLFQENFKSLVPALHMNHTIEHFSLDINPCGRNSETVSAELLEAILNHTTIKHFEWNCGECEWMELVPSKKPKAMDKLVLEDCSVDMDKIVNLLQQLSSLKCLHLKFTKNPDWHSEFLPLLSRMGMEEFSLSVDGNEKDSDLLSIAECLFPGLNRLSLHVNEWYDSSGLGAALASTVALRSLEIFRFDCIKMSTELVEGLVANESLRRIELGLSTLWDEDEPDTAIDTAIELAKIIEAIMNHSSISFAKIDCHFADTGCYPFLPKEFRKLHEHLEPGLFLVLSSTTEEPPENAAPEKIQAVMDIYKRIVERYTMDDSTSTETSSPLH